MPRFVEQWLGEEFITREHEKYGGYGSYREMVKSIGYDQHVILRDIMDVHNGGKPFDCDMTYSKGMFYGDFKVSTEDGTREIQIPPPIHKFDVCPQCDGVERIEPNGPLPLADASIGSIVVDLPFLIWTGQSVEKSRDNSNIINRRFTHYHPASALYASYAHWIGEAWRVLGDGGICVFKTQATVSGGIHHCVPLYSCMVAQKLGFAVEDEFILLARSRLMDSRVKRQLHARNFHSHFYVFVKSESSRFDKSNCWRMLAES